MNIIAIGIILYLIYSIAFVFIFIKYDVNSSYQQWVIDFPNWKKRLLLFIISGFICHLVIGSTFLYSKLFGSIEISFDWFKK